MLKRARIIAISFLLCLVSFAAVALPDLIIDEMRLEPSHPVAGEPVLIEILVFNQGTTDVDYPFFVHFTMDGRQIGIQSIVGGIKVGRSRSVSIEWLAEPGTHSLSVEVDPPTDRIEESNESNNQQSIALAVALSAETMASVGSLKLVVAPFEDISGSGFLRAGEGLSDKMRERFEGMGLRVLSRTELETIMQQRALNPSLTADWASAAAQLGADILIVGSVSTIDVQETSLQLGILAISSAEVNIRLSASLVDVRTNQTLATTGAEGSASGTTGFSFDLGGLLDIMTSDSVDLCGGGLQTARSWYNVGEGISIAFRNPGTAKWFSVEITSSTGAFVRWLGWQYVDANACSVWNWDQQNPSGFQMPSGVYTAKIWDGIAYIAEVSFQIRPGVSLTVLPATEITVGTQQFEDSVVGGALNLAANELAVNLLGALENTPLPMAEPMLGMADESPMAPLREGQIASILPDERIAINIGASSGVASGEMFDVLNVADVVIDPQTHEILDYVLLGVKGQIVITEVRDRVSYAVRTTGFEAAIGDIVRSMNH